MHSSDDFVGVLKDRVAVGKIQLVLIASENDAFRVYAIDRNDMAADTLALTAAIHADQTTQRTGNTTHVLQASQSDIHQFTSQ